MKIARPPPDNTDAAGRAPRTRATTRQSGRSSPRSVATPTAATTPHPQSTRAAAIPSHRGRGTAIPAATASAAGSQIASTLRDQQVVDPARDHQQVEHEARHRQSEGQQPTTAFETHRAEH